MVVDSHIRLATREDVAAIVAISNTAAASTIANFCIEPESIDQWLAAWDRDHRMYPWLVAEDEAGAVIAFAKASPYLGRCAYHWTAEVTVYIDPEHHGRGLGTALYERLFAMLMQQGYRSVFAGIALPNPASRRLHEKFGLDHVGTLEDIGYKFGGWHSVAYYFGHLGPGDAPGPPGEIIAVDDLA